MSLEAQNNPFTSILIVEAADPEALPDADPAAGQRRIAVGTDHLLYLVDDSGVKTQVGGATGAPSTVNYLVGTADGGLSAEIVVGTTPGGELGGTWGSPTVDATHSGSAHILDHTHAVTGQGATGGGATLAPTSLNASGLLRFGGSLDSTVNADQNDFAPTGIHTVSSIRFTSFSANRTITGIEAGSGGEVLILVNNTSFSMLLTHESASSTAANRFRNPNAGTVTVRQQGSAWCVYIAGRWCVMGA